MSWQIKLMIPLAFTLLLAYVLSDPRERAFEESRNAGNMIKNALTRYKESKGSYPSSLSQLVPEYMNKIPKPSIGEEWLYEAKNSSYRLMFLNRENGDSGLYDSIRGKWTLCD